MGVAAEMKQALNQALNPERVEIVDDSQSHAGHAGARPEGETHFTVTVVSSRFEGLTRLERQRLVYSALDRFLEGGVHALSVRALARGEG